MDSDRLEDARALLAQVRRGEPEDGEPLEREGSPLMQGAAGAVRVLLGQETPEALPEPTAARNAAPNAADRSTRSRTVV